MTSEQKVANWCEQNDYLYKFVEGNYAHFERKYDNYPFKVDMRLMQQVMQQDEVLVIWTS